MILGREEILKRLNSGDVFRKFTWDEKCLQEASYALRIADDGLLIDGTFYNPGVRFEGDYINIDPGKIAILSTQEEIVMPADLVGKIGIRLNYALLGLTGLMGIQVDPRYGSDKKEERLFIRVANFGNAPIRLSPGDMVFTFELHEVSGEVPKKPKQASWPRIKEKLSTLDNVSWSYVTQIEDNFDKQAASLKAQVSSEAEGLRQHLQPVVLFGIFLVAVTILGVALGLIMNVSDTYITYVPRWAITFGWVMFLITLSAACVATASMGVVMTYRLWRNK